MKIELTQTENHERQKRKDFFQKTLKRQKKIKNTKNSKIGRCFGHYTNIMKN
jgi:hypothetical protein